MAKYNLYPTITFKLSYVCEHRVIRDIISFCNGDNDLDFIATKVNLPVIKLLKYTKLLQKKKLIKFNI